MFNSETPSLVIGFDPITTIDLPFNADASRPPEILLNRWRDIITRYI